MAKILFYFPTIMYGLFLTHKEREQLTDGWGALIRSDKPIYRKMKLAEISQNHCAGTTNYFS